MKKKEKIDLILILIWPVFAYIISLSIKVNLLFSILIFYILPSIYISFKLKAEIKKAFIFALLCTLAYIIAEAIGNISQSWVLQTIFPFKVFGTTIEGILWALFTLYFAVMFYEYFLDHHITKKLYSPRIKYLLIILLALFSVFLSLLLGFPSALNIPFFYLKLGIIFILMPILLELFTHNKLINKFVITAAYFFYFHLLYEIAALKLNWWTFPNQGQFIGWVSLFSVNFPLEELFFFIMLTALVIITFYEFFDDDEK